MGVGKYTIEPHKNLKVLPQPFTPFIIPSPHTHPKSETHSFNFRVLPIFNMRSPTFSNWNLPSFPNLGVYPVASPNFEVIRFDKLFPLLHCGTIYPDRIGISAEVDVVQSCGSGPFAQRGIAYQVPARVAFRAWCYYSFSVVFLAAFCGAVRMWPCAKLLFSYSLKNHHF